MKVSLTFWEGRAEFLAVAETDTEKRMLMALSERPIVATVVHDSTYRSNPPSRVCIQITAENPT